MTRTIIAIFIISLAIGLTLLVSSIYGQSVHEVGILDATAQRVSNLLDRLERLVYVSIAAITVYVAYRVFDRVWPKG